MPREAPQTLMLPEVQALAGRLHATSRAWSKAMLQCIPRSEAGLQAALYDEILAFGLACVELRHPRELGLDAVEFLDALL